MALAAQDKVRLRTEAYGLEQINQAIDDLLSGELHGRGVIVPNEHPG